MLDSVHQFTGVQFHNLTNQHSVFIDNEFKGHYKNILLTHVIAEIEFIEYKPVLYLRGTVAKYNNDQEINVKDLTQIEQFSSGDTFDRLILTKNKAWIYTGEKETEVSCEEQLAQINMVYDFFEDDIDLLTLFSQYGLSQLVANYIESQLFF